MFPKTIIFLISISIFFCTTASNSWSSSGSQQNIPPTSKFSKISSGMSERQVYELIGESTDFDVHLKVKTCCVIPLFGGDTTETTRHYKGEGRIIFNGLGKVTDIQYDPSESGHK